MRVTPKMALMLLNLLAGSAAAQQVTYDYDKTTDFSRFKSYAWTAGTPVSDELNHKRIVAAVDSQLTAKGLHRVEPGEHPDLQVSYRARFTQDLQVRTSGWGGPGWVGNRMGTARVEELTVGTLVVELTDPNAQATVWRAVATHDVDGKASPERRDRNINKAAEKMFKHYPPKA